MDEKYKKSDDEYSYYFDDKNKKTKISLLEIIILIGITVILIPVISLIIILVVKDDSDKYEITKLENDIINEKVMTYLNNKYGSSDFEIDYINKKFAANGFIATDTLTGYDIKATYIPDNIKFYIYIDVENGKIEENSFTDNIIYYNYSAKYFTNDDFTADTNKEIEKINTYLKEMGIASIVKVYSNYPVSYYDNNKVVPNDYGKIPSKDELYNLILNYHIKHDLEVEINESEIKNTSLALEIKNYLINLTDYLISYYNGLEDYKIRYRYENNRDYYWGTLKINNDSINIVGTINATYSRVGERNLFLNELGL